MSEAMKFEKNGIAENQFLTFCLDEEVYGFDIAKVREVLDYTDLTKVPRMPEYMRGVINLRGSVVPVVDMRQKFGMPSIDVTVNTCFIIVEIVQGGETTVIGAMADSVREVVEIDEDHIEPAPRIGTTLKTEFIRGMGKQNEQFIILLDIDRVFSGEEIANITATGSKAAE